MALNTCEMLSNGIKIAFSKNCPAARGFAYYCKIYCKTLCTGKGFSSTEIYIRKEQFI